MGVRFCGAAGTRTDPYNNVLSAVYRLRSVPILAALSRNVLVSALSGSLLVVSIRAAMLFCGVTFYDCIVKLQIPAFMHGKVKYR